MRSHRTQLKTLLFVILAALAQPVFAQKYPSKAIRFIVGFAPGGPNDIVAPANTPSAIVKTLNEAIVKLLSRPDVQQQFAKLDLEAVGNSPQQMTDHLQAELTKWTGVVRDAKLSRGSVF